MKTHQKKRSFHFYSLVLTIFLFSTLGIQIANAASVIPGLPGGIDSGASNAYTTAAGVTFEADYGRTGGVVRRSSGDIQYSEDDTLYHSRVVAPVGSQIIYRITPPRGVTQMQIFGHFNEHYHQSAGRRLVDVTIRCPGSDSAWNSGMRVEQGLDIFDRVGGRNRALVRNWGTADVSGGEVEITISASAASPDAALISALEFVAVGYTVPQIPNLPGGINSGASAAVTTAAGVGFEADYGRTGGIVRNATGAIAGTQDDTLYHSRVVAPLGNQVTYLVVPPLGATRMQVIGHFNEHYHQRAGNRLIDVNIRCPGSAEPWNTGVMSERALDIYAEAGGKNRALVRNWGSVDVSGGELEITISASANGPDAALINAIEFVEETSPPGSLSRPQLLDPKEGSSMDNGCPEGYGPADPIIWDFSWLDVPNAEKYELSILKNGTELIHQTVTTSAYTYICFNDSAEIPLCELDPSSDDSWSWRVRAGTEANWSNWSVERNFYIGDEYRCLTSDAFGLSKIEPSPSSPAVLEPGSKVTIDFMYWAPYEIPLTISVIPYYQNSPLPETAYIATTDELYTEGYDGGNGQAYLQVNEEGLMVDMIWIKMLLFGAESFYVDYHFTSNP